MNNQEIDILLNYVRENKLTDLEEIPADFELALKRVFRCTKLDDYYLSTGFIENDNIREYFIIRNMPYENFNYENKGEKTQKEMVEEMSQSMIPIIQDNLFHIYFESLMDFCIHIKHKFTQKDKINQVFYNILDLTHQSKKHMQWNYLHGFMINLFNKKDYIVFSNKFLLQKISGVIAFGDGYMERNTDENIELYKKEEEDLFNDIGYLLNNNILLFNLIATNESHINNKKEPFIQLDLLDFFFMVSFTNSPLAIVYMMKIIKNKLDDIYEKNNEYVIEQFFTKKVTWYQQNLINKLAEIPLRANYPQMNEILVNDVFKFTFLERLIYIKNKKDEEFNGYEYDKIKMREIINEFISDEKYISKCPQHIKSRYQELLN